MENQLMQQYQPNMVQSGQQFIQPEMQQYQPQLPQVPIPQLPQMSGLPQMSMQTPQQVPQQVQTLVKLEKACLTAENYHAIRLTCEKPAKKLIPIKNDDQTQNQGQVQGQAQKAAQQHYWIIELKCNYGTALSKEIKTFFYECCEVTTSYGVKSETNSYGKFKSSIAFNLDEGNKDHVKLMEDLDSICMGAAQFLFYYKDEVGREFFDASTFRMIQATGFKPIVTRKAGRAPALYGDLIDYNTDQFSSKTPFTYGEESKVLDWKDLKGMTFKCMPLLRFKQIFIGGKGASIQWDIKSAIVTSPPVPYKSVSMQADTMKKVASQRPDWKDSIEAQIAKNNMLNQDKKMGADLYIAPKESAASTTPLSTPLVQGIEQNQQGQNSQVNVPNNANLEQFMNSNPQQPVVQFS
jgi:hypothetical protein